LEGFAAKVFQHEYDHLQGIENIDREDAIVQAFDTKEELLSFMQQVKKEDSVCYKKPISD
jgi:peptide deformylase